MLLKLGFKMRVLKLFVVSVLILMTSCEKLEDFQGNTASILATILPLQDHPKSTINNRFKRQAPINIDATRNKKTVKPSINIVKTLNVRPLVPGNQGQVLNPTKHNPNNVIARPPVIARHKVSAPLSNATKNLTIESTTKHKHEPHNTIPKTNVTHAKNIEKEQDIKGDVKVSQTEKALPNSEAKEIDKHKSDKTKAENDDLGTKDLNEDNNTKLIDITPPKLESKSKLKEDITPPDLERESKSNDENILSKSESKNEQTTDVRSKVSERNKSGANIKRLIKKDKEKRRDNKDLTPKEALNKVLEEVVKTPVNNEPVEEEPNVTPKVEITRVETNTGEDKNVNLNNKKTNDTHIPSVMTLDNSLKLEGGEEIVIQNNDYEELYENNPQYDAPKLVQSELRSSQPWTNNQNEFNQNLYDDQLNNYNQYIYNAYNGLKNKYNYNNRYQPQKYGQWPYQARPGRIWRAWRNNQIFIRPKYDPYKNGQYNNGQYNHGQYNDGQYKYWNNYNSGQNVPSYTFGVTQGNQNTYPFSHSSCSCGLHGY